MTAVLPAGWTPLPFVPERGVPQQAQARVGGRTVSVILAAVGADLVALLAAPGTVPVVDGSAESAPRLSLVADARAAFTAAPPGVLDAGAVRPYLIVAEAGRLIGSAPVVVGRPLVFATWGTSGAPGRPGVTGTSAAPGASGTPAPAATTGDDVAGPGLRVELLVAELTLAAGSLVGPVAAGSSIVVGVRDRAAGRPRPLLPVTAPEGKPYDLLVQ